MVYIRGGKHKARGLSPALHLVLSGPAPCFYPAAVPSSRLTVKEGYMYTILKLHSAPWRQPRSWCVAPGENEFDTPGLYDFDILEFVEAFYSIMLCPIFENILYLLKKSMLFGNRILHMASMCGSLIVLFRFSIFLLIFCLLDLCILKCYVKNLQFWFTISPCRVSYTTYYIWRLWCFIKL